MNWLDFLIIAIIGWFTVAAYLSGFIRETLGLAAVLLGVLLAGLFHDNLAENLQIFVDDETATRIVAFLAIFVIVAVAGWAASLFLRSTARLLMLGWADRVAGALFGFLKGVLIIQAVTVIFILQPALGMESVIADSMIGAFFLDNAPVVGALLPTEFDSALQDFSKPA
jgi:membrane protein required for colicin V production